MNQKKRQTKVCEKCPFYFEHKIKAASDKIERIYCYCDASKAGADLHLSLYFLKRADGKTLDLEWEQLINKIFEDREPPEICPCKLEHLVIGEKI